ncbi:MAG: hypothetical protein QOD99_2208 [Chthoniobacter sp.]|jgi:hypothetical protein|nr:hypothetical protein [Chthoniobacter sp.]
MKNLALALLAGLLFAGCEDYDRRAVHHRAVIVGRTHYSDPYYYDERPRIYPRRVYRSERVYPAYYDRGYPYRRSGTRVIVY